MSLARVVFTEGFDDRGFLDGALRRLGCVEPEGARRNGFQDALGTPKPHFSYLTPSEVTVRLVQTQGGGARLQRGARAFLKSHAAGLERVLVVHDADTEVGQACPPDSILPWLRERLDLARLSVAEGRYWTDESHAALPPKQTLERIVCAAILRARPERVEDAAVWLEQAPVGGTSHKNHAHAHFAKWYAHEHGSESFFRMIWNDEPVALELERLLDETGIWTELKTIAC